VGEHVAALFSNGDSVDGDNTPPSPMFAGTDDSSLTDQPLQTDELNTAPATAASGTELAQTPTVRNLLDSGWLKRENYSPFSSVNAALDPADLTQLPGVGELQAITQSGVDVAAVLKLYETCQQRAKLADEAQSSTSK
tara:strand:- start:8296 stop:8709 length:414 start_codon:yes stop_codon:yes gene_type:complete